MYWYNHETVILVAVVISSPALIHQLTLVTNRIGISKEETDERHCKECEYVL